MPQLSNRFATTEKSIKQSFSLGRVHETIRQAHRDQAVSLDVLKELIKHPDPEVQLEVFNALKKSNHNISRYIIESRLSKRQNYPRTAQETRLLALGVTSCEVVGLFLEHFWTNFVPVFHCLQGRFAADGGLWKLVVVKPDIAVQCRFQLFA